MTSSRLRRNVSDVFVSYRVMPLLPESDSESASAKSEDEDGEEPCL